MHVRLRNSDHRLINREQPRQFSSPPWKSINLNGALSSIPRRGPRRAELPATISGYIVGLAGGASSAAAVALSRGRALAQAASQCRLASDAPELDCEGGCWGRRSRAKISPQARQQTIAECHNNILPVLLREGCGTLPPHRADRQLSCGSSRESSASRARATPSRAPLPEDVRPILVHRLQKFARMKPVALGPESQPILPRGRGHRPRAAYAKDNQSGFQDGKPVSMTYT